MTHPVQFKFLLLLTFAVWMQQSGAFESKSTVLFDCCNFGRNRSKMSCNGHSYDFNLVPRSLQVECKSQIKYCCRKQRETDDCNEGIIAAQNGSTCPSSSTKYKICHKACQVGIKMAEKGEDCNKPVNGEEMLEINAREKCCVEKREEVILPDDEETDEVIPEEDEYGDEEQETFSEETSSREDETTTTERTTTQTEPTTTTTTQETTERTTATTNKPEDYDETTMRNPSTTTEETTTTQHGSSLLPSLTPVHSNSLETNEIDTATTTRRSPPKFRHQTTTNKLFQSSIEDTTTIKPQNRLSIENSQFYYYQYRQHPENSTHPRLINHYFYKNPSTSRPISPIDPSRFQASIRNSGNNPEPCGDNRYCDHSCIISYGVQHCSCNRGYILQRDGRTCLRADGSRLPPEEIRRTQKRCQRGHFLNDLGDCQDIDECKIQNNGCGDKAYCRNTIGSYECLPMEICRTGFKYNTTSNACDDIDECYENKRICEDGKDCHNTVGSYTCEDSFNEFKARCEELVVTTPPTTSSTTTTRWTTSTQTPCYQGYTRNHKGACVDIDECIYNPCEQGRICVNQNGGYKCEPSHCTGGLKPEGRTCVDINECDNNPCPLTHNCINTHGSYTCKLKSCPRGYRLDTFGGCEDINECNIYQNLCRNADCINTDGSFVCNCMAGYRKDENNYCRDINECKENIHDCSHKCHNTFGGYQCYCENGYRLNSNNKTCDDIDECRENGDLLCQGECVNTLGSFECRCPAGFRREDSYCTDIDECQEQLGICDRKTSRCLNIPGSHRCMNIQCKDGYKLLRRNGERYCHLRTPCGDDDYDEDCNKPWLYSYSFTSRIANCSASNIFHLSITTQLRYDVVIEDIQAYSTKDTVRKAGFDDFIIQKISSGFFLASTRPIDGPQDIDIDVLVTFYRPDGSVEHKRGVKVKMVVSEFSFNKFSVRK